ncbi:MAG: hypothetical protein DMF84_05955 [Acidobacteria bacterium]|nr:MAG: hypothetical protein DMF84_05955 [Acidobacteriota bacterium]
MSTPIGSRFTVHGSRFTVHGSRFMVHGSWFMVHGSRFTVQGSGGNKDGLKPVAVTPIVTSAATPGLLVDACRRPACCCAESRIPG